MLHRISNMTTKLKLRDIRLAYWRSEVKMEKLEKLNVRSWSTEDESELRDIQANKRLLELPTVLFAFDTESHKIVCGKSDPANNVFNIGSVSEDAMRVLTDNQTEHLVCNSTGESSDSAKEALGYLTVVGIDWRDTWAKIRWSRDKPPPENLGEP